MASKHERSRSNVRYETSSEGDARGHVDKQVAYGEPEVIEVVKKPGETAGFYIREGNGFDRRDGIFVSRILASSSGRALGYLRVGDEILKVNGVAVRNMALDDVVILMLVPQKLTMLIRRAKRVPVRSRNKLKPDEMDSHDSGLSSEHSSDLRAQRALRASDETAESRGHSRCTCSSRKERNISSDNERELYERDSRRNNLSKFSGSMKSIASVAKGCCDRCPCCDQRMPNEDNEATCSYALTQAEPSAVTPMQSRMLHFGETPGAMQLQLAGSVSNNGAFGGLASHSAVSNPALPSAQQLAYDNLLNMTQRLHLNASNANNGTQSPVLISNGLIRRQSADALNADPWGAQWNNAPASPLRYASQQLNVPNGYGTLQRKLLSSGQQAVQYGSQFAACGLDGQLVIRVCAARQLQAAGRLRDLYVVVEVDTARRCRTQVRSGAEDFEWDETFEIELLEPSAVNGCSRVLSFLLFAWDAAQAQHALCAYAHVSLAALANELGWFGNNLQSPFVRLPLRLEAKGTFLVEVSYRSLQFVFRRQLSNAVAYMQGGSLLFGVPLDLVAKRHCNMELVPRIVRQCVEELERRGVAVTGLYKQTGSLRTKERLRELFERASVAADALVDLSVESVPDVHCIASLLKDYLRELPEPLIVPSVGKALLDTMYSCLASQTAPLHATKLALAVLDRLPVSAQATLTYLMDHLKRVLRKSESNKMSLLAISCLFGPLFLCQACLDSSQMFMDIKKHVDCMRWLFELWPSQASQLAAANSNLANAYAPMSTSTSLHNLRNRL